MDALIAELHDCRMNYDGTLFRDNADPYGADCGLLRRAEEAIARLTAELDAARRLVRKAITDYIEPEIRNERAMFLGHENCSDLDGLRADLAEFQALAGTAK